MGLFDRIVRRSNDAQQPERQTASNYFADLGINVTTPEQAMAISAVYRCVNIVSQGIAQLPLEVKARRPEGYYSVDEENPLNYLLTIRPNSRMTAYEFRQALVAQLLLKGNAYVLPQLEQSTGDWGELILLSPGSVDFDKQKNRYNVHDTLNRITGKFEASEIIHVKNLSLDGGNTGLSTVEYAARVLGISANADSQQSGIIGRGGVLKGFISGKGSATMGFGQVQSNQLNSVSENISTEIASGKDIFSLPGDMDFHQIAMSPKDYELLETKKFQVYEIARFFGVPPEKLYVGAGGNYKSSEMAQVAFLTDTLQPIMKNIELAFASRLIPRELFGELKISFNIDSLLVTDLTTQAAYMEKTIASGVKTVNYWRRFNGEKPVEGGDRVLVSTNLAPLDSAKLSGESE